MKVVCGYDNMWGHSCRIVDPIRHMAKRDAKAEGEAPAATEKDPILSALKIDQVAIKDNEFFTRGDFNVPQSGLLFSHVGQPNGEKIKKLSIAPVAKVVEESLASPCVQLGIHCMYLCCPANHQL